MLAEGPQLKDSNFEKQNLKNIHNGFIADQYINLLNRVIGKKFMKKLPARITFLSNHSFSDFKEEIEKLAEEAESAMEELDFQKAFTKIERIVYLGNHNLSTHEFWQLVKSADQENIDLLQNLIYLTFEVSRISSLLLTPFCPGLAG